VSVVHETLARDRLGTGAIGASRSRRPAAPAARDRRAVAGASRAAPAEVGAGDSLIGVRVHVPSATPRPRARAELAADCPSRSAAVGRRAQKAVALTESLPIAAGRRRTRARADHRLGHHRGGRALARSPSRAPRRLHPEPTHFPPAVTPRAG
jgi:hypothetical protein